jgi:hypothetical protein
MTDFATVRMYLNGSNSPITKALFVREERLLATVAELLAQEHPTDAQRSLFARWIREGQVKVGVNAAVPPDPAGPDCLIDLETVSDEAGCHVLFLPPYYLVHLRTPLNSIPRSHPIEHSRF